MSLSNLFLQQQMSETQRRIEEKQADDLKRRQRAGLFSSFGGGIGGLLGGLAAGALTAGTGGLAAPLLVGLGAGGGSLLGARAGLELGDGRRGDAVKLGQNVDVLTGKAKEFGQSIKDRYRRDIDDFQTLLNTNILGQALNTGLKAAAFSFANPALQKGLGKIRNIASGNQLPTPAPANIAGAQAYQPAGMGSNTLIDPARAIQAPMRGPMPAPSMAGMGPLSNQAFDAASAVSNPFLPESVTNILGQSTNYAPTVPLPTPAVATTPTMSIPTPAMNIGVTSTSRVAQPNNFLNMVYGPTPPPSSSNNVSDILYSMIGVE